MRNLTVVESNVVVGGFALSDVTTESAYAVASRYADSAFNGVAFGHGADAFYNRSFTTLAGLKNYATGFGGGVAVELARDLREGAFSLGQSARSYFNV